eukprot:2098023-Pleurochrysis_carterae.AAC.1
MPSACRAVTCATVGVEPAVRAGCGREDVHPSDARPGALDPGEPAPLRGGRRAHAAGARERRAARQRSLVPCPPTHSTRTPCFALPSPVLFDLLTGPFSAPSRPCFAPFIALSSRLFFVSSTTYLAPFLGLSSFPDARPCWPSSASFCVFPPFFPFLSTFIFALHRLASPPQHVFAAGRRSRDCAGGSYITCLWKLPSILHARLCALYCPSFLRSPPPCWSRVCLSRSSSPVIHLPAHAFSTSAASVSIRVSQEALAVVLRFTNAFSGSLACETGRSQPAE